MQNKFQKAIKRFDQNLKSDTPKDFVLINDGYNFYYQKQISTDAQSNNSNMNQIPYREISSPEDIASTLPVTTLEKILEKKKIDIYLENKKDELIKLINESTGIIYIARRSRGWFVDKQFREYYICKDLCGSFERLEKIEHNYRINLINITYYIAHILNKKITDHGMLYKDKDGYRILEPLIDVLKTSKTKLADFKHMYLP